MTAKELYADFAAGSNSECSYEEFERRHKSMYEKFLRYDWEQFCNFNDILCAPSGVRDCLLQTVKDMESAEEKCVTLRDTYCGELQVERVCDLLDTLPDSSLEDPLVMAGIYVILDFLPDDEAMRRVVVHKVRNQRPLTEQELDFVTDLLL